MTSFIEKCVLGGTRPENIDDFVEQWHEGDSELPLHEYLGMTKAEYSLWMTNPDRLSSMIHAQQTDQTK
uniref:Uncharacterized protein n=1 Tax=Candidatus Kentrum sp. FM TaxID=2126340 RepID=A0A450W1I3_9GAMM|nr:MAG: hypothetical protein BECKFM1743C_GA0114222_101334 [Candidatus Kentron sp. FM]VFJ54406.1 MAG: hypothetical protein BECKFM1743A_GA0114220_101313 [Candidatus Kentron sp. FM]VFK10862.1 MAG: hypothetical protein BECKFM1743B_GA0114221_101584 [Candidatus Kentron sp. FM]